MKPPPTWSRDWPITSICRLWISRLSANAGQRTVFGCSSALRHTLNPDAASITFSSKSDLTRHWIVVVRLTLDRDWSWYAPGHFASLLKEGEPLPPQPVVFEIQRSINGAAPVPVGRLTMPGAVNHVAAQNPDRRHTSLVFFDAFDPKPAPGEPLEEPLLDYRLTPVFRDAIAQVEAPREWSLRLPITTPPAQTPRIVSAGFAFGDYLHDDRYSTTEERPRMLFFELDAAPADPKDKYFARVLLNGPDPMLLDSATQIPRREEPPLPIDPEPIRFVRPGQSNDFAGLNAMQPLTISPHSDRHYLLPLPKGMTAESPELFGFFVYELRVGHDGRRWCTAQGRFGNPLRLTGVQHPAPQLRCSVRRTLNDVVVMAPFATPIWEGQNVRPARTPHSTLQALLYAQVLQVDGAEWRNVLLNRVVGQIRLEDPNGIAGNIADPRLAFGFMEFRQDEILRRLSMLGLPLDSPLSVVAVELLPEQAKHTFRDPLGHDLGQVRILRTSTLTAVPPICPPLEA